MFLTELFESTQVKHAAFCFGRMNPPTLGHGKLIETVEHAAQGGDYFIFASQTQDRKDNPLDYATKIKFIKALFPQQAGHVVFDVQLKTIMQVAEWLYSKGYTSVTFVAGSDRMEAFQKLLESYNGVEGKKNFYKFAKINFVSSGEREDGAEGVEGVSASQARAAAVANNMDAFTKSTGAGKLAPQLFQAVRKGMLLEGSSTEFQDKLRSSVPKGTHLAHPIDAKQVDEHIVKHGSEYRILSKKTGKNMGTFPSKAAAKKHEREIQYFKHMEEDASGYIPKNKREARDPRWSNALTVDVHPDTPNKNLKAFKLA